MKDTHRQQYRATFVDASEAPQLLIDEVFFKNYTVQLKHSQRTHTHTSMNTRTQTLPNYSWIKFF